MSKGKVIKNIILLNVILALFVVLLEGNLQEKAVYGSLQSNTVPSEPFRALQMTEAAISKLKKNEASQRGSAAGIYLLRKGGGSQRKSVPLLSGEKLKKEERLWAKRKSWDNYKTICDAIWKDVRYFPVPQSTRHSGYTVNFVDSWMGERTYGGRRGHEGTDIMASKDKPGLYPVLSMTDGTVTSKGWLEKGGWRLGITAPSGGYFYYAHMESYGDVEVGDRVRAGDVIGFMGNSGYGPEGTTGMFATHLHVGIYIYPEGQEISVNPYWVLRFLEEKKLSCSF